MFSSAYVPTLHLQGFGLLLEARIHALTIGLGGACSFNAPYKHRIGLSLTVNR